MKKRAKDVWVWISNAAVVYTLWVGLGIGTLAGAVSGQLAQLDIGTTIAVGIVVFLIFVLAFKGSTYAARLKGLWQAPVCSVGRRFNP